MMDESIESHSDHGTVLQPDEAALVVSQDGEFQLLLPDYGDDVVVPDIIVALASISMKLDDPDWISSLIAEVFSSEV